MTVPLILRIGTLVVATTGFYTYVGQMVPQKEVQPPTETTLGADMTTADMVKIGHGIMEGKGICLTCHTIGKTGALRFPDLAGIGANGEEPRAWPERRRLSGAVDVRTARRSSCRDSRRRCRPSISLRSASPIRRFCA